MANKIELAEILKISLHGRLVGYLSGYQNGRNILRFANEFIDDRTRPTFSLITSNYYPNARQIMLQPWLKKQKLHPILSNLLPEGSMRELIAQGLKTHINNEFQLLSYLGQDLPGALVATPIEPEDVPDYVLTTDIKTKAVKAVVDRQNNNFSLAGIQIKFSMIEQDGRYNLCKKVGELGDWIIKTPSTKHENVPLNEYTAMSLAAMVDIDVPEIQLVELDKLDNLPRINLPDERYAFAIKRFDRKDNKRLHMEDFAQVLVKYSHEKYNSASYEQVGKIIYNYCEEGLLDVQQFAKRLLVNILLANGDAHLKNWSLWYQDQVTPRLSPAYDIVTTNVYIADEKKYALNLGKTKEWYKVTMDNFQLWADKVGVPWRAIKPQLGDAMEKARILWPRALPELPMTQIHKVKLKDHWRQLHPDFRIET